MTTIASKTYIDVLEELEKTTGTNEKIEILHNNKDVEYLKWFLDQATDPKITYGIATIEDVDVSDLKDVPPIGFIKLLELLSKRELTGNEARKTISHVLSWCSDLERKWFKKCLLKDLASIGLGLRLLEKGFDEIKKFRLMLANPEDELHKTPDEEGVLDKKANGVRTVVPCEGGKVIAIYGGRNGLIAENFYFLVPEIEKLLAELDIKDIVLDGEVHVNDILEDTMSLYGFKYRTEAEFVGKNGKIKAKAYETYLSDEQRINAFRKDAMFTIFDAVTLDEWNAQVCEKTLKERKLTLKKIDDICMELELFHVSVIQSEEVSGHDEAITAAQKWIAKGFEGGIYKPYSGLYEWKRSKNWVKIKECVDFEVQFIGYEIQKDKYNPDGTLKPPMVGKVKCVDADGNEYKIGTGKALSEKVRQDMLENWDKNYQDKIGTCSAQRPSGKGKYICPRLDIIRLDRSSLVD